MWLWRRNLSGRTRGLLLRWSRGEAKPDHMDLFLYLQLTPLPTQLNRPLLSSSGDRELSLHKVDGWAIYSTCTKVANLSHRPPTVWSARLGGQPLLWRTLYKPFQKKRTGGLQWRILHGAIATNSILNRCLFCGLVETIFHMFAECSRLPPPYKLFFFSLLDAVLVPLTSSSQPLFLLLGLNTAKRQKESARFKKNCEW